MADVVLAGVAGRPALAAGALEEFSQRRGEPPALTVRRLAALETYLGCEAPDRVSHLWRYTDPAWLLPASLPAPASASAPEPAPASEDAAGELLVWLGGGAPRLSDAAAGAGVQATSLSAAGADLDRLGRAVPAAHGLFEALNAAAWTDGVLVRLPRGAALAGPLHLVVAAGAGATLPRLLVVAEAGAEATVVEEHVGGGAEARVVGVSELFVDPGARLQHVVLQRWAPGTAGHLTTRAVLARDAGLLTAVASLGGAVAKLDLGVLLAGEGARSEMVGVALGEGRQHFDHHTRHEHAAPHTWSNLDIKAVLAGRARSAYTGLIRIGTGAPHSEAYQENRNLMLSDRCRADSIPELEILTDEVSCTHGATVAPVPEQLFYLRSRGLARPQALRLIVRGFFEGTLRRLPEPLRGDVEALVTRRLAGLYGVE